MSAPSHRSGGNRLELVATLLLSLAAVATAWASYQSSRWHGEQAKASGASITARVESTRSAALANGQTQVDIGLFSQWIDAYARNDQELATFYRRRFRPEFKPAFRAWIATRPRKNPRAPLSPFALPEYKPAAATRATALEAKASAAARDVATYIERADDYVLAVVLFAVSLFFAGMSMRMRSATLRVVVLTVAWVCFGGTVIWLATFPVSISV